VVVLLGYVVLIVAYLALVRYQMNSSQNWWFQTLALAIVMGVYYSLAHLLIKKRLVVQIVIALSGVAVLIAATPALQEFGAAQGGLAFKRTEERSVTDLPYKLYGPTSKQFVLDQVKSAYSVGTPTRVVDLVYQGQGPLVVQNIKLPATYDPPSNCVTTSGLVSNLETGHFACGLAYPEDDRLSDVYTFSHSDGKHHYYIKRGMTLLIIHASYWMPEDEMYDLVSTLRELTPDQLKSARKGITYGAGS
jgi:hypothetical protein